MAVPVAIAAAGKIAAKEGVKVAAKEVAKNAAKETAKNVVKEGAKNAIKEGVKDTAIKGAEGIAKQGAESAIKDAGQTAAKNAVESGAKGKAKNIAAESLKDVPSKVESDSVPTPRSTAGQLKKSTTDKVKDSAKEPARSAIDEVADDSRNKSLEERTGSDGEGASEASRVSSDQVSQPQPEGGMDPKAALGAAKNIANNPLVKTASKVNSAANAAVSTAANVLNKADKAAKAASAAGAASPSVPKPKSTAGGLAGKPVGATPTPKKTPVKPSNPVEGAAKKALDKTPVGKAKKAVDKLSGKDKAKPGLKGSLNGDKEKEKKDPGAELAGRVAGHIVKKAALTLILLLFPLLMVLGCVGIIFGLAMGGGDASGKPSVLEYSKDQLPVVRTPLCYQPDEDGGAKVSKEQSFSSDTQPTAASGDGYSSTITFGDHTFKLFQQWDGVYKNDVYNTNGTISANGCGPTSLAVILSGYDSNITPRETGKETSDLLGSNATALDALMKCASNRGMQTVAHNESPGDPSNRDSIKSSMRSALLAGHQLVVYVGKGGEGYGEFTSGWHWIPVLAIDKSNDKVFVGNTNKNAEAWYDLDVVVKAMGTDRIDEFGSWGEVYSGSSSSSSSSSSNSSSSDYSDTLIIGDSICDDWCTGKIIDEIMPGITRDAVSSRTITDVRDQGGPDEGVLYYVEHADKKYKRYVIETGNNESSREGLTPRQAEKMISDLGSDKDIYFVTMFGGSEYGKDNTKGTNSTIDQMVEKYSNVHKIDWYSVVNGREYEWLDSVLCHPNTDEAKRAYAQCIKDGLGASSSSNIKSGEECGKKQEEEETKPFTGDWCYYCQGDPQWAGVSYGSVTIGPSGCWITSFAMAWTTYSGEEHRPDQVVGNTTAFIDNGLGVLPNFASELERLTNGKVAGEYLGSWDKAKCDEALSKGGCIFIFMSGQHMVDVIGHNGGDTYTIADPATGASSEINITSSGDISGYAQNPSCTYVSDCAYVAPK